MHQWQRIVLLAGTAAFIAALALGLLEHDHEHAAGGLQIFDEYWVNLVFAVCSLFVLWFTAVAGEHFVQDHLWNHVIKKHFLSIFLWSFGALLVIGLAMHWFDLESLVKGNIPFMILLAVLIGLIPACPEQGGILESQADKCAGGGPCGLRPLFCGNLDPLFNVIIVAPCGVA